MPHPSKKSASDTASRNATANTGLLRFIPEGGALVEVSCPTIQSRYLLRPSPALREILLGVLGRAQRLHQLKLCGFVFLSNHFHLLARPDDAEQLARFLCYFLSNLAREVGRLVRWRDKIWSRRYDAIVVSDEAIEQIDRLRYLLANGCKEGLVASPLHWPGVHMVQAILEDKPLVGYWFDRTKEYGARLRREEPSRLQYATEETVVLSQLPCWDYLSVEEYRNRIKDMVTSVEQEAAAEMERTQVPPLGADKILRQSPHAQPKHSKKSPAPPFHAATKAARDELRRAYGFFLAAFREAADKLRAGDRTARFPLGSFPPGLPFVRLFANGPP